MVPVRFMSPGLWLNAVKTWKDQFAEPWAYLEEYAAHDRDAVNWFLWVQGSALLGNSLWFFQLLVGRCPTGDGNRWDDLKTQAQGHVADIRSALADLGIPVVRAFAPQEGAQDG